MKTRKSVIKVFQKIASKYDAFIEKAVPHYHEQHEIMFSLMPFSRTSKIRALDLGTGTGVLGELVLKQYPNSTLHAIDASPKMIEVARKRFKKYEGRFKLSGSYIETVKFKERYDLVLAGLSIHHLDDPTKKIFFRKIYAALKPGGVFLIRDIIKSSSGKIGRLYYKLWASFEAANGLNPDKMTKRHRKNDIPATVENHIKWLRSAGFKNVDCAWKYLNFAIFVAYK